MKTKNMMLWMAMGLLASSAAFAHPPAPPHSYHGGHHAPPHVKPGPPPHAPAWGHKAPHYNHTAPKYVYYKRGDRLPQQYFANRYYVNDWRAKRLSPPPRGHRWVEVDGRYILAAVATGVIASIFMAY